MRRTDVENAMRMRVGLGCLICFVGACVPDFSAFVDPASDAGTMMDTTTSSDTTADVTNGDAALDAAFDTSVSDVASDTAGPSLMTACTSDFAPGASTTIAGADLLNELSVTIGDIDNVTANADGELEITNSLGFRLPASMLGQGYCVDFYADESIFFRVGDARDYLDYAVGFMRIISKASGTVDNLETRSVIISDADFQNGVSASFFARNGAVFAEQTYTPTDSTILTTNSGVRPDPGPAELFFSGETTIKIRSFTYGDASTRVSAELMAHEN